MKKFLFLCISLLTSCNFILAAPSANNLKANILKKHEFVIVVEISKQLMSVYKNRKPAGIYTISTAKNGPGQIAGSMQTPTGLHRIKQKLGKHSPTMTVFSKSGIGGVWDPKDKKYQD